MATKLTFVQMGEEKTMGTKYPTIIGLGCNDVIIGHSKRLSGMCLLIISKEKRKLFDWIEFTSMESAEAFRDLLTEAIEMHKKSEQE